MAKRAFTETWIANLKPPETGFTPYKEAGRRGFLLRAYAGGSKVFFYQYSWHGKSEFLKLREWLKGGSALADAHREHAAALDLYVRGINPKEEREREANLREVREQHERAVSGVTVRNVIAEWAWHYARKHRKRPLEAVRLLKGHLLVPVLTGKAAAKVTKRDLVQIIDRPMARKKFVMANRLRDLIAQIFRFAAQRDLIPFDPASGLISKPGGKERGRKRNLNVEEVRKFWATMTKPALDAHDRRKHAPGEVAISYPIRLALKLILVTAQRPGEVAEARWSEFDLTKRVWTIPPDRIKTVGKRDQDQDVHEHLVPLTDMAIEIIGELHALAKGRPFVVPCKHSNKKPDAPISEKALSRALKNCHVEGTDDKSATLFGMPTFTPNDLRRTAASHMGRINIDRFHQDRVLNHADTTIGGTYDQWTYWPQKLKALTEWDSELRAIVDGKQTKVTSIRQDVAA
jgi:integrase